MNNTTVESITHRRVLKIAVPIVLSNATIPLLGVVDTGVVGQLGEATPIGAVGIGAIILTTVYWFFGFLRLGISGLASQARGQRDFAEISALLVRSLVIGFCAGSLLIILQVPILSGALLISPASPEVEALASEYAYTRIYSAPAAIAIYGITGWLIANERAGSVMILQIGMNGLNMILDIMFVLWLDFGVRGVAIATLIAEWSGLVLGLWLCRGMFRNPDWRDWPAVFDRARLRSMALINTDILIRSVLLEAAFVTFFYFAAAFGDLTLAANQILLQFLHVTAFALDGFAFAAEALVGLSVGAGKIDTLRRSVLLSSAWGMVIASVLSLGFAVAGPFVIDLMATSPDVRSEARRYLPWVAAAPILGCPSWMLDGIFIGATCTKAMRNAMFQSLVFFYLTLALLLPAFGNHGLWLTMLAMYFARTATLGMRYGAVEERALA